MPKGVMKPTVRICEQCGSEFISTHSQSKLCSDACREKQAKVYQRRYFENDPERKRASLRRNYERNSEKVIARTRAYQKTEAGVLAAKKAREKHLRINMKKILARDETGKAVKSGILTKSPCPCGSKKTEAHHEDYSKPLDVIWLCRKCHATLHKQLREQQRRTKNA